MAKLQGDWWTLVQHSAYGYQEKPGWDKAVETRKLTTEAELDRVRKVGGLLFSTYDAADQQEYQSNYPDGAGERLMYPQVKGTFSDKEVDGLKIYIPVRQVVG
jgi:hypothetical protein